MGAARGHRTNEYLRVEAHGLHSDPVAEQGASGERAGGIDRHDPDGEALRPEPLNQGFGERALAGAGRPGDADAPRATPAEQAVGVR